MNAELYFCIAEKLTTELPWYYWWMVPLIWAAVAAGVILEWFFDPNPITGEIPGFKDLTDPQYPYFGGGAGWSCLCGGNVETYCCDSSKNPDYCLDKNTGKPRKLCDAKTPCFDCKWDCERNA